MKKLLLITALLSGMVWAQEFLIFKHNDLNVLSKSDLKLINIENDKFQESIFIKPKNINGSIVYPYIVIKGDDMFLRIVTRYSGSNWIYFEKFHAILDDVKYEYKVNNISSNVSNGRISEISDMPVDQYLLDFLYAYSNLKGNEEIRYEGESKVIDLNDVLPKTKNRIKDLLIIFEKLKID